MKIFKELFFSFFHLQCLFFRLTLNRRIITLISAKRTYEVYEVDGVMKFYEFKVLPFGLTSAPYVFY